MKSKVRFIAALFCMGYLATEPAADIKAAGIQVAAAQTTLSADNSLEVLSLSAGTLSPDFTGKTVQYTATVPNDVTSVTVTATPVNEFATVQSISRRMEQTVRQQTSRQTEQTVRQQTSRRMEQTVRQQTSRRMEQMDRQQTRTQSLKQKKRKMFLIWNISSRNTMISLNNMQKKSLFPEI